MKFVWFALAALSGGLLAILLLQSPGSLQSMWQDPCRGFCGKSTRCVQRRCQSIDQVPRATDKKAARKRSGSRRLAGGSPAWRPRKGKALPWAKDSHVPRFKPNAVQQIAADDESGRLDNFEIDKVLATLEPAWKRCIERADTRAAGQLANGRVSIAFGVNGQGRVIGVNAKAPAALAKYGIVPCVRVAAHAARFPAYKGPITRVTTHFDVSF